ncbi:MAG: energy transducer TonB [Acidobacteria bacterium]|nr:energy transducer TonB [Acidobacteriota bacterium]
MTFIIGAAAGGFSHLFKDRPFERRGDKPSQHVRMSGNSCRHAFAETKGPEILYQPLAHNIAPRSLGRGMTESALVLVTLGANGKVQKAAQFDDLPQAWSREAQKAAWQIQFTPAMLNGVPVSIETPVEIFFESE